MPPPSQQHTRINLADLKSQIVKKLGPDRANRYFTYLNRFLSQKLGKSEFDKWCYLTLGRQNLHLHNQFIRSILKNACYGTVPPPLPQKDVAKSVGKREDGYAFAGSAATTIWSNGDVLPMSPRKVRSVFRDRRGKDRPSPLGPNGRTDLSVHHEESVGKGCFENGEARPCDVERPLQHRQCLAEQPEAEREVSISRPMKKPRVTDPMPLHTVAPSDLLITGDGEELEQAHDSRFSRSRSPLRAPLGIPFCPASVGGARRTLPMANSNSLYSSVNTGELWDTESLRGRIEPVVQANDCRDISLDATNVLNHGVDAFLKRLLRSVIELGRARSGHEPIKHSACKQLPQSKLINGAWPGHHLQNGMESVQAVQDDRSFRITLLDFQAAMDLNPKQLGEDWPMLLEKIRLYSSEE